MFVPALSTGHQRVVHVCGPDMKKIKGCRNIVFNIFISEAFVTASKVRF